MVRKSATPSEIWAVSAAILPNVLTFTLPMAVLVGILTGFGRLSSDSETIAMRAAGVSMRRILGPVLVLAITAWLVNLGLTAWIGPKMIVRLKLVQSEIVLRSASLELQPGVFNEQITNVAMYVRSLSSNRKEWNGIMLADMRKPDEEKI